MKPFIWGLILALVFLHQDFWYWKDGTLILGFMPVGMFYHVCLSAAAVVTWFLAVKFAWPDGLEAETTDHQGAGDS